MNPFAWLFRKIAAGPGPDSRLERLLRDIAAEDDDEKGSEEKDMSEITGRVERGAALLDDRRPGWWQDIDLVRLDVRSSCDCIAGQQPGGFEATMNLLDIGHSAEAAGHGFDAYSPDPDLPAGEFGRVVAEELDTLTEAWRDLILRRRELAEVSA